MHSSNTYNYFTVRTLFYKIYSLHFIKIILDELKQKLNFKKIKTKRKIAFGFVLHI